MVQLLRATLCLAALAGAAASVGELHTKSFIKRKNWPKPAGPGSLPGLAWGKLKLDLGKGYKMRDQDIGFGMKIRVYDYKDLWDLDNIEEAGWAMVHKINYIPDNAMTNWNKYPVRHQIRSCFIHNFKHSLTTIQSKMSVMGANTKWSANSRGEISFVQLGYNWGWLCGKEQRPLAVEGRFVAGKVCERLDKGRVLAGRDQLFLNNKTSFQVRWKGWGMDAILSQPFRCEMPQMMFKTKHDVNRNRRFVGSRTYLAPWLDEDNNQRGINSYFQCEYHDQIVDTAWDGEWIFQFKQPLSVFPGVRGRDFIPSIIVKRKWDFANGFLDKYVDYPDSEWVLMKRKGLCHRNAARLKKMGKKLPPGYTFVEPVPPPPPRGRPPRSAFVQPARLGRSAIFSRGRRADDLQAAAVGAAAGTTVTVGLPAAASAASGASNTASAVAAAASAAAMGLV